jgi:uncharacterized cupin superfamily protein
MDEILIVNLADAIAVSHPRCGTTLALEPDGAGWPDTAVKLRILEPGKPNGLYHSEPVQEDFLVLHGECLLILEGEQRTLTRWDFFHCPAGVEHIFVGAGERPCAVLMIGSRRAREVHYPVDALAARHGASVSEPTDDPEQAYAEWWREPWTETPNPWPLQG